MELRIVKGRPDAEELAAVTAVLWALLDQDPAEEPEAEVAPWTRSGPYVAAPGGWLAGGDY